MRVEGPPTRAWLVPPWHSWRARLYWSAAALPVLLVWQYFILAASMAVFPTFYTPWQTMKLIAQATPKEVWPGEYGSHGSFIHRLAQIGPVIAGALWCACVLPRWNRSMRIVAAILTAIVPLAFISKWVWFAPIAVLMGPFFGAVFLTHGSDGEGYEDLGAMAGTAFWFWLMVPVVVLAIKQRRPRPGLCATCGYSLAGLPSPLCPECGVEQTTLQPPP